MNMKKMISYIKTTFALENIYFNEEEILNVIKKERKLKMKKKTVNTYLKWEDYLIEGTDILKNIPNIVNQDELTEYERNVSAKRLVELYMEPLTGEYNYKHLCQIHEYLFQDIYEWAGETRTNPMMKQTTVFMEPNKIEPYVEFTLGETKKELENIHNKYEFASCLSNLFYCLIHAHPFREGNGRAIREFIRQLVNSKDFDFGSYDIDYSKLNNEIIAIGLTSGAIMFLTPEFQKALVAREPNKVKKLQLR